MSNWATWSSGLDHQGENLWNQKEKALPRFKMELVPSGKRLHNELENRPIFNGKFHYFYGHVQ